MTVAVDNDDLVKNVVERRESMKMLELLLEPGTVLEMNNLAGIAAKVDRERGAFASFMSFIVPGIPELFRRVVILTIAIRGLAQQDYPGVFDLRMYCVLVWVWVMVTNPYGSTVVLNLCSNQGFCNL